MATTLDITYDIKRPEYGHWPQSIEEWVQQAIVEFIQHRGRLPDFIVVNDYHLADVRSAMVQINADLSKKWPGTNIQVEATVGGCLKWEIWLAWY